MKKIALINSVYGGGGGYLNYLSLIAKNLQNLNYEFDIFQPDKNFCGLTIAESETILNHPVLQLQRFNGNVSVAPLQNYEIVISNDAFVMPFCPENICTIFTNHGTTPLPLRNILQHADALTFCDAIFCYSNSTFQQLKLCLQTLRKRCKYQRELRKTNRKTYLIPTFPLKLNIENLVKKNSPNLVEKYQNGNLVIALLPTSPLVIFKGTSLFDNVEKILNYLGKYFPLAKIILRPHLPSLEYIPINFEILKTFAKNTKNFEIDFSGQNSNDFYNQCDILITDSSTGGISFLLHKKIPSIYFIPREFTQTNLEIQHFINLQKDKVLFAHHIKQLIKQIEFCINSTENERLQYFENAKNDLFLKVDNKKILQKIIKSNFENFPFVDENGNFFEK